MAILVAALAAAIICRSGAYGAVVRHFAVARATDDAWQAVAIYGRGGTTADKRMARSIVRRRLKATAKKKGFQAAFEQSKWSDRLKDVRKGSPDPGLPGGPLTAEERAAVEVTNLPLEGKAIEAAKQLVEELRGKSDPVERRQVVDRLVGLGEAGLPGLARLLQDSDAEIAGAARAHFVDGVREVENDRETAALAKVGLLSTEDSKCLDELATRLIMCIDQKSAMRTFMDVIAVGTDSQVAAAKNGAANIIGEDWTSAADAEKWLAENIESEEESVEMTMKSEDLRKLRKDARKVRKERKDHEQ